MRKRRKKIPFDFRKYLLVAEYLLQEKPLSDANKRSAISRVYYGCFQLALRHLRARRGLIKDSHSSQHTHVIYSLRNAGDERAAYLLHRMRTHRNSADYSDSIDFLDLKVMDALACSREFQNKFFF